MVTIAYEQHQLSNGLDVILHEDHTIPLVAVNVWYHVGSKNEEVGRTGFAHLFEHVMFEGTKHHNNSHFEPLQKAGANLNGSTTTDRTNYWEDVPSNYLELALWLEADRMGFLLDGLDQRKFDVQRDVVKNERRQSYENRPYGMAHWHLQSALFPLPHPYHWMTIGSQEDLDAASLDDVKDFFRRFYGPSNASLAIAGDFHPAQALELAQRYFGDLPPGENVPRIGRQDSALAGRIDIEMRDKVTLPRLYLAWPAPPEGHPDDAPLELYQAVMSDGLSSRLHRSLVYEKQIAQHAFIRYVPSEIAGQLLVQVTAAEGHSLDEIEAAVESELANIHRHPPTDEEIARSKNRIEAAHYRQLARIGGFGGRADQLNHFNVLESDAGLINTSLDRCLAVQRDDILRVAQTYIANNRVRLRVMPETPLSPAAAAVDRTIMPPPAAEPAFTPPLPSRDRLPNGMGLTVVEQPGMPIVAFGLLLGAGASDDPAHLPGLAGLVGEMLSEGAAGKSSQQIANDFEFIGARLSVDSRREYTLVSTETLSKHWPRGLEMLGEIVMSPDFPQHELERVRREHLTELRRGKDEPNIIAEQLMSALVYPHGSGYAHPIAGTEKSAQAITRDDLVAQFRRNYRPENARLLVVGDTTREQVIRQANAIFAPWTNNLDTAPTTPSNPLPTPAPNQVTPTPTNISPTTTQITPPQTNISPPPKGEGLGGGEPPATIYLVDRPNAPQSVIRAVQPLIPRTHPDYFPLLLANYAFGGQFSARLNQNLRQDKGYSYGYQSFIQWYRRPSMLVAGGSVQSNATKESVYETIKEFNQVHSQRPITPEELANAKDGLLRAYPASFERPLSVLSQLVTLEQFDLPADYFRSVRPSLEAVTLDDLHRAAQTHIRPESLQILVVGDRATIEPPLSELSVPIVNLTADGEPTT